MRIRSILILAFLISALVPSVFFGWWAYQDGIRRQFSEVSDRHLLLAKNLGNALERYYVDLVAISESVTESMIAWEGFPNVNRILVDLNIENILLVERSSGKVISKIEKTPSDLKFVPISTIDMLAKIANTQKTEFTQVVGAPDGSNIMYAVKSHDRMLAITKISTKYFDELGKSVSFGVKGHAAIVDNGGNVLAHPLPAWVKSRKNISKVSAVKRMLNGETGIEQFYSPALKGDMIAGLTSVSGPGWGVMIPQPVSELYDNAAIANRSLFFAITLGILISLILSSLILNSMGKPLKQLVSDLHDNGKRKLLRKIQLPESILSIVELKEFQDSYNSMVEKISAASEEMEVLAYTDSVTKLPNRMRFHQITTKIIGNKSPNNPGGCLIFVDIDNFKVINDLYGHATGDKLLKKFAAKLTETVTINAGIIGLTPKNQNGATPFVSRIGGDEFTILVPGLVDEDKISWFLDTLLESIHIQDKKSKNSVDCSASIGCARYPADASTLPELMRLADIAMYHAKKQGKNRAQIYNSKIGALTENEIRSEFSKAIANNQLVLEYQPKICTRRKVVSGVEALVRWNHPKLGKLAPGAWIPAISQTSLIVDLGNWVIGSAMRDMHIWKKGGHDLNVAVNISSEQLSDQNLMETLKHFSKKYSICNKSFEIEITEDTLFADEALTTDILNKIKNAGFMISIDDFGKGYSNFARLAQLPIDFIKLDQTIVNAGAIDEKVKSILDATIVMAKILGSKIVAEGIETLELANFATGIGANVLQGYYFSRSLPAEELTQWLEFSSSKSIDSYRSATDKMAA